MKINIKQSQKQYWPRFAHLLQKPSPQKNKQQQQQN